MLLHFLMCFGSLFRTESDPKSSADRFSDKKGDSEQTLVITMYLKDFTGPKRPKKRLWGGFWGQKMGRKTRRRKIRQKDGFGGGFGAAFGAENGRKTDRKTARKNRSKKKAVEDVRMRNRGRAVVPLRRLC